MTARPDDDRLEAALEDSTETSILPSALRTMRQLTRHVIEEAHRRDALLDKGGHELCDVGLAFTMYSVGLASDLDLALLQKVGPRTRALARKFDLVAVRGEIARRAAASGGIQHDA